TAIGRNESNRPFQTSGYELLWRTPYLIFVVSHEYDVQYIDFAIRQSVLLTQTQGASFYINNVQHSDCFIVHSPSPTVSSVNSLTDAFVTVQHIYKSFSAIFSICAL